jgi:hypothetical protein
MEIREVLKSQYLAALEMLQLAVERCPEWLWDDAQDRNRFWHVAFHALFYTHLYLQDTEEDFVPWAKQREEYQFLGQLPWPPHRAPRIGEPYSHAEILEYAAVCAEQVEARVEAMDLAAASGFWWQPLGKLEHQIYNIRHLQQHTGELMERLGARAGIEVEWVGRKGKQGEGNA